MAADFAELTKQVKEASDIVAVLGGYLSLRPAGPTYKAVCPFHDDSRPSLDVDPRRQRYRCWSCGAMGDVFKFVMETEKVDFMEARAILARRANITIDADAKPDYNRIRMKECLDWAQKQFQELLLDGPEAEAARKYLGERKLSGKTVRDFGLGFAPGYGDWIVRRGREAGIDASTLVDVGLTAHRDGSQGFYDRFRDRVMFPIRDARGQTVGFGGRILPTSPKAQEAPKYYNSAETALFNKSELLFGLDTARHVAARTGTLAIVEGYTDVMMAHQFGLGNVVATMGTALNAGHIKQLRRYATKDVKVVLVFDADAGGKTGIDRALEIFVGNDLELLVATLPESLDPCDLLVQPGGKEIFEHVLAGAVDALDFKMNDLFNSGKVSTIDGKRRAAEALLRIMAAAPEEAESSVKMKRDLMMQRISQRLGMMRETVQDTYNELRAKQRETVKPVRPVREENEGPAVRSAPAPAIERQLLEILLGDPSLLTAAREEIHPDEMTHPGLRRLLACLYRLKEEGLPPDEDGLRMYIDSAPLIDYAMRMQDVGRSVTEHAEKLEWIVEGFRSRKSKAEKDDIKQQLQGASDDAAMELLRNLQRRSAKEGPQGPEFAG